ncbi:MAG: hypothetical protein EOM50_05505 [Erysipelotrichia bacterium]|nr:hypothetical protein [Erysipelotrichia bacterium]
MKKRIWITAGLAVALIGGIGMASTVAEFQADGTPVKAQISMNELNIEINGSREIELTDAIAGEIVEKNLTLKNTKDTSLYTRVIVDKYWKDAHGEKDYDANGNLIQLTYNESDWIVGPESEDEKVVLYYKGIVEPSSITSTFLDTIKLDRSIGNAYANKQACIEVKVDAVQSFDGVNAILNEWGVLATLDENGNIVSIER